MQKHCPSEDLLTGWSLGSLSSQDLDLVAAHVSGCPTCQARMLELDAVQDQLIEEIRHAPAGTAVEDGNLSQLLHTAIELDPSRGAEETTALPVNVVPNERYAFLSPPQGPGELGRLGIYRVLEVLGEGGMGMVFKAEDPQLKRPVALKTLRPEVDEKPSSRQRFVREARAMAALNHPHIATIFQVGEENGVPYLAMELLPGQTLERQVGRKRPLPMPEVLRIGREVADALAHAHEHGLVHRDIKPSNIWLREPGASVKVLDFGLARMERAEDVRLTQTGVVVGTPAYMAPEQANGTRVDARADLFSLGSVLYLMCTGIAPFQRSSSFDSLLAVTTETPKPVRELNREVPVELDALITRLLAKKPEDRPASAAAVRDALDLLLELGKETEPVLGAPEILRPPPPAPAKSGRRVPWIVVLLLFAVGAGVGTYLAAARRPGRLVLVVRADNFEAHLDDMPLEFHDRRAEVPLSPGRHHLQVRRPGFLHLDEDFDSNPGQIVERLPVLQRPPLTMPDAKWFTATARMKIFPAGASPQARKVGEKLAELNPGFDPDLKHQDLKSPGLPGHFSYNWNQVNGDPSKVSIVRLTILTDHVTNLWPVAGFPKLGHLECRGSATGLGRLYDLSPLQGMKQLHFLDCRNNAIDDFAVLKNVPLKFIWCDAPEEHWEELQEIPTLRRINGKPVPWRPADGAGESPGE